MNPKVRHYIGRTSCVLYLVGFVLSLLSLGAAGCNADHFGILAIVGVFCVLSDEAWIRYFSIPAVILAVIFLLDDFHAGLHRTAAVARMYERLKVRQEMEEKEKQDKEKKPPEEASTIKLADLPPVDKPFKIAPYVKAAAFVQSLGKEKGCDRLKELAEGDDEGQVAIMCRLLFTKKGKPSFRRPGLGAPICVGGTNAEDWPLEPIELVNDVPFFVVLGYELAGEREPSLHYLRACIENCDWSTARYDKVEKEAIEKALQQLLASAKWKRPLTNDEREFLISQTK